MPDKDISPQNRPVRDLVLYGIWCFVPVVILNFNSVYLMPRLQQLLEEADLPSRGPTTNFDKFFAVMETLLPPPEFAMLAVMAIGCLSGFFLSPRWRSRVLGTTAYALNTMVIIGLALLGCVALIVGSVLSIDAEDGEPDVENVGEGSLLEVE